jgi:hypothetical protein
VNKRECVNLCHQFSENSGIHSGDEVEAFFNQNYHTQREQSYGWTYLHECLKDDDEGFYNIIKTMTYNAKKIQFESTHAKILYPPMIVFRNDGKYETMKIASAKEAYVHVKYKVSTYDKKTKKSTWETKSFIFLWLKDANLRVYDRIVFKPSPLIAQKNEFNTWDGFPISHEPLIETERDFWEEYKTYLKNIFGDEKISNYILARYAYRLVNPGCRTHVILIICGGEGHGKNRLLAPIYNIMGSYGTSLDTAKKLYETHSTYECRKLCLVVNEAGGIANFENSDILKTRATEPTINVNPKGIQHYEIDNMCDYDMTTNNYNVVKITDDSTRRFLQVETTPYYRNNCAFFTDYTENIENNPTALRQIYEGLINFDYKAVVPSLNFQDPRYKPASAVNEDVKSANRDKIILFMEELVRKLKTENRNDEVTYTNDEFFKKYKDWCVAGFFKDDLNKHNFGMKVTHLRQKQFNTNGLVCVAKCPSNSKTTLHIGDLVKYFNSINVFFE